MLTPMAYHQPAIVRTVDSERQTALKVELLKHHPYCCKCGCPVVAMAGRQKSASLVVDRLACPGCVPNVRAERIRERMTGKPDREISSGKKRDILKARLMASKPHCTNCGRAVFVERHNEPDQAHLVWDRLSCSGCVRIVRKVAKAARMERRADR